jgi:curved DNA-binding protein CbpA
MEPLDEAACRRILEVSAEAHPEEISQAYLRLKRIYQDDRSPVTAPSMDEFSDEARRSILADIERAYAALSHRWDEAKPHPHPPPPSSLKESLPLDGPGLRKVREAEDLTLDYIAAQTHVRREFLAALEEERFADLPHAAVNVRGFLTAYVTELGLPAEALVAAYMQRFQQWQGQRR